MKTKNLFTLLTILALIISAGCERTDFDEILRRQETQKVDIDDAKKQLLDHEARITALENLVKTANADIATIKGLVDALEKKVSIVSYNPLADGTGYELSMSDGSKITLKNGDKGDKGDKGDTPIVNVKLHTDGVLYWTINGEWMLDAKGNKVPATGKDGQDGKTPQMRVNTTGNWEMSLDGGTTWQEVKDTNGNPVKAIGKDGKDGVDGATGPQGPAGQDGDANLTITETSTAIIIVYKGVTYKISKETGLTPDDALLKYAYVNFGILSGSGTITAKMSDGTPVTSPSVVDGTKQPITFTATPAEGYEVVQWLDDGEIVLPFPGKVYSKALHKYHGTTIVKVEFDEIAATSINPALIIGNWKLTMIRSLKDGEWQYTIPPTYSVQFLTTSTGVVNGSNFTYTIGGLWLQQSTSYPSSSIPEYAHVKIRKLTATELVYSYDYSDGMHRRFYFTKQ